MCHHDWMMRRDNGLVAYCTRCSAEVRLLVQESPTQYRMDARVLNVGQGGVTLSDCNFLCDSLYGLLEAPRLKRNRKKRPLAA